ncbi:hypothetical protein [Bradyrhizobium sp. S3.5.5]|uniref:hypothetical protein n=1 Tax=Bradyrhizobium sp. S3.5.5 TaxID=3156430 RepID=UPI0033936296
MKEWEGRDYPAPYKGVAVEALPVIGEADIYGQKMPMTRYCGFPHTEQFSGDFEEMSLLAGEPVGQMNEILGVEEFVNHLMGDAATIIKDRLGAMTRSLPTSDERAGVDAPPGDIAGRLLTCGHRIPI